MRGKKVKEDKCERKKVKKRSKLRRKKGMGGNWREKEALR